MRLLPFAVLLLCVGVHAEPLPIDPLWKSETFRRSITASFGIDSRIEPVITEDEAFYLDKSAKAMADGDRSAALAALRDSSLLEKSPAMLFSLATLEFEAGESESSISHFQSALEQFPNFRDAHRNLAVALVQTGNIEAARPHLDRALALGSFDGTTFGLVAYARASAGNHQSALDAYRLAMLTQPNERQWKLGEAQALLALKQPREAGAIVQGILKEVPADMNLWKLHADTLLSLNEELNAAADLEIVYRSGALEPNTTLSLAHIYLQNDLPDLAMERYSAALTAPEPATAPRAIEGLEMLLSQEDWARAKEYMTILDQSEVYRKALDPQNGEKALVSRIVRARALLEMETGDAAAGAKLVEGWLQREPMDGSALVLLARFRKTAGLQVEAEMLLEQAARIPDSAAEAYLEHARIRIAATDYKKGLELLRKSQELKPRESLAEYIAAIAALVDGSLASP